MLTLSLLVFAAGGAIGGSGFLAVYLAGLVAGNSGIRAAASLKRFQDGVSWLAQIIMFLVLGLFATPSQFLAILPVSVALGLFLIFVARPVAVWLCLIPFRFPRQETAFISWVGLRGAVSILLAITPLLGGLENGRAIFNTAFIVVLVSLVIQGWTVGPLARRLGLIVPQRIGPLEKVELELPGSAHHELLAYTVVARQPGRARRAHPALGEAFAGRARRPLDEVPGFRPPRRRRPCLHLRTRPLSRGCSTGCSPAAPKSVPTTPISSAPSPSIRRAPQPNWRRTTAPGLTEAEQKLTIGQLMQQRLGGHAEYADRVTLGTIELIVRDVDENGKIVSVGLSFEPTPAVASIPAFLSAMRIGRPYPRAFRRLAKRRRRPRSAAGRQPKSPNSYNSRGN